MIEKILARGALQISIENVSSLDKEEYALSRKNTFGASDSAVLLGVNPYADITELLNQKASDVVTDDERAIGEKAVVKKGFELEEFVLQKAQIEFFEDIEIIKPPHTYTFKEFPYLSINYDGIVLDKPLIERYECPEIFTPNELKMNEQQLVPVEIKIVNTYAYKMWKPHITNQERLAINMKPRSTFVQKHIEEIAAEFGIPAYYYTQMQQQIAGLRAEYGYFVVQYDVPYGPTATWSRDLILIKKDAFVMEHIIVEGYKANAKVAKRRKL